MINKTKNVNLQITISKKDLESLKDIQELYRIIGLELTKSQAISLAISNFFNNTNQTKAEPKQQNQKQPSKEPKTTAKPNGNYQRLVIALKDKLGVSYPRLSQLIGIPTSTLKKYGLGQQTPSGENLELLTNALNRYGIK